MTNSGYLVVTKRASPNESYRGVDRLPPFFFGSAEPDAKAVEDYVFGGWRDDSGLIVDLGRATELLSRFNDPSMYEIIRVDRSASCAGDGFELTGYDVACVSGDCTSIFNVDIELLWRGRETHFNRYGLARSASDAMELLKWYVAQQLPGGDDALEVVAVYRQTGAG